MNRKILGLLAAIALVAGCEVAKKTTYDGPIAQCRSTVPASACTENAECCSYGCVGGFCKAGDHIGTVCATTNDCGYPDGFSFTQMTCKAGNCAATTIGMCRDDADVCASAAQCCSHHCGTSGSCVPNRAPVIQMGAAVQTVPRNQPYPLINGSTDPDGDSLSYGWTITPVIPPTATGSLSSPSAPNPVFTPGSTIATYVLSLDVTDYWGLTSSGQVTLNVVNTQPVVAAATGATTIHRNVGTVPVSMSASDSNNDSLACTWKILRPDGTQFSSTPVAPFASVTATPLSINFPTGLLPVDEGAWTVTLTCDDQSGLANALASATTTVTVVNDPPVITVPTTRTFNLGAVTNPEASVIATAVDPNGDAIVSWAWTITSAPVGSAVDTAALLDAATQTVRFTPDVAGVYTLGVSACDQAACGQQTVVATVYPHIRALGHTVTDAAFAKGASLGRLVLVGPDSAIGALWQYDLTGPGETAPVKTPLDEAPVAVGVSATGNTAVTAGAVYDYKVTLGASLTPTRYTAPASAQDVAVPSDGEAYLLYSTTLSRSVDHLNLSNGTFVSSAVPGTWGAATPGFTNQVFIADLASFNQLVRYSVQGNGSLNLSASGSYSCGRIWSSANGAHLFSDCGDVYTTNASTTLTPLSTTLGTAGIRSVDTSSTEAKVLVVTNGAPSILRYGSAFTLLGTDGLPHWGTLGADRGVEALFAFASYDGTRGYVVLRTTSGSPEYGLYTYTLP